MFERLTAAQKERAFTDQGVTFSELSPDQQRAYREMLVLSYGIASLNRLDSVKYRIKRSGGSMIQDVKGWKRVAISFLPWDDERVSRGFIDLHYRSKPDAKPAAAENGP